MSISPVRPRASSPLGVRASDGADRASPLPRALPDSSSPLLDQTGPSMGRAYHPGCTLCSLVASLPSMNEGHDLATPSNSPFNASFNIPGVRASTSASDPLLDPPNAAGPSSSRTTSPVTTSHLPNGLAPDRQAQKLRSNRSGIFVSQKDTEGRRLPLVVAGRDVLYFDDDITVYAAKGKERLCAEGSHLIMVVNRHIGQVYDLSSADVPMLSRILDIAWDLLHDLPGNANELERGRKRGNDLRIGFVGSMFRDPFSPHDHLHAHALMGPVDTSAPGATFYRRNVIFGSLNWWAVEDLRAEIREETSNNRVKSGYEERGRAPIDRVPDAGSISGLPNALDAAVPSTYQDDPQNQRSTLSVPPRSTIAPKGPSPSRSQVRSGKARADPISPTKDRGQNGYADVSLDDTRPASR